MSIIPLTKEEFLQKVWDFESSPSQWVFLGKRPAVVYFVTRWCGPCRIMTPILERLSTEYSGRVDFYSVDTDNEPSVGSANHIRTLPTTLFCPMQGNHTMRQGPMTEPNLRTAIENIL